MNSRQQTRHRTFGWNAGDPVAHNFTVKLAKRQRTATTQFRAAIAACSEPIRLLGDAFRKAGEAFSAATIAVESLATKAAAQLESIIADAEALGMDRDDALNAIERYRRDDPLASWTAIRRAITYEAINDAVISRAAWS